MLAVTSEIKAVHIYLFDFLVNICFNYLVTNYMKSRTITTVLLSIYLEITLHHIQGGG